MEASSIISILESRIATTPGGCDRDGRPLLFVNAFSESQGTATLDKFDTLLQYLASLFSPDTRGRGICVVVDATRGPWRIARNVVRQVSSTLGGDIGCLLVLRHDAFWDNCTRAQRDNEPIFLPLSRLQKYIDLSQLPEEYSGLWLYDHSRWIANRIDVEEFVKGAEHAVSELERLRTKLLGGGGVFRLSMAEATLSGTSDVFVNIKHLGQKVLNIGETITQRLDNMSGQDQKDTKDRLEKLINVVRGKLTIVEDSWLEMHRNIVDAKEVEALEDGVRRVTEWILGAGESMLIRQQEVGYDISSAEELRQAHNAVELQCRETYGHYAELVHKIDQMAQAGVALSEDLTAQRDFMDFVCRSFATRLERRRNILITSARFFRLVSEYFQNTSEIYEKLVMSCDLETLESAHNTLFQLQTSQESIGDIEISLVREGEKLSDLLSMPVKDSFGRDLGVSYENDIVNIKEILDMTSARKSLFQDSVELQRLTVTQVTHIYTYEKDAEQALQWLEDLFKVMCRHHAHVGCTDQEIQIQKEQHQVLQETAKSTYDYGCQLLKAALSLRQSCKFQEDLTQSLKASLGKVWEELNTVGQEQLTRLRVSAVFYRNVKEQCNELHELMDLAKSAHLIRSRGKVRKLLANRERLLLEIGRMVRLGRLLKSRLREPLSSENTLDDMNETAVEAISEKLAEVALLAEELDKVLQTNDVIPSQDKGADVSEWYKDITKINKSTTSTNKSARVTSEVTDPVTSDATDPVTSEVTDPVNNIIPPSLSPLSIPPPLPSSTPPSSLPTLFLPPPPSFILTPPPSLKTEEASASSTLIETSSTSALIESLSLSSDLTPLSPLKYSTPERSSTPLTLSTLLLPSPPASLKTDGQSSDANVHLPPPLKLEDYSVNFVPEPTSTPRSRSSSFHTASDGEAVSPWWEMDPPSDADYDQTAKTGQQERTTLNLTKHASQDSTSTTGEVNNNIIDTDEQLIQKSKKLISNLPNCVKSSMLNPNEFDSNEILVNSHVLNALNSSLSVLNELDSNDENSNKYNPNVFKILEKHEVIDSLLNTTDYPTLAEETTDFSEAASCEFRSLPSDFGNSSLGLALFESTSGSTNSSTHFCESSQSTISSGFHETTSSSGFNETSIAGFHEKSFTTGFNYTGNSERSQNSSISTGLLESSRIGFHEKSIAELNGKPSNGFSGKSITGFHKKSSSSELNETSSSGYHETSTLSLTNASCLETSNVSTKSAFQEQLRKQALTGVF